MLIVASIAEFFGAGNHRELLGRSLSAPLCALQLLAPTGDSSRPQRVALDRLRVRIEHDGAVAIGRLDQAGDPPAAARGVVATSKWPLVMNDIERHAKKRPEVTIRCQPIKYLRGTHGSGAISDEVGDLDRTIGVVGERHVGA